MPVLQREEMIKKNAAAGNAKHVFLYNGQGWFLKIDTVRELNAYLDMIWKIRKDDLMYDLGRIRKNLHPTSDIVGICDVLARLRGRDLWAEFDRLRMRQSSEMSRMVIDGHALYVNPSGGYCAKLENVSNRYDSEELRWPVFRESDVRIKQWPGGTHWYAYVGPIQVKSGDKVKFDSESDARAAAMAYVNNKPKLK